LHVLEGGDGVENELDGVDEAQASGIGGELGGGLGHDRPDGRMGDEEPVEFLDHPDGFLAAQGVGCPPQAHWGRYGRR
jgi:hypothetical protein